jgi:hypothetical protein
MGYLGGFRVHVHRHDPLGLRAFEDSNRQGANGAAADHQCRLSPHVSHARDRVPGDACRLHQGSGLECQARAGKGRSIRAGRLAQRLKAPSVWGKRAALPR